MPVTFNPRATRPATASAATPVFHFWAIPDRSTTVGRSLLAHPNHRVSCIINCDNGSISFNRPPGASQIGFNEFDDTPANIAQRWVEWCGYQGFVRGQCSQGNGSYEGNLWLRKVGNIANRCRLHNHPGDAVLVGGTASTASPWYVNSPFGASGIVQTAGYVSARAVAMKAAADSPPSGLVTGAPTGWQCPYPDISTHDAECWGGLARGATLSVWDPSEADGAPITSPGSNCYQGSLMNGSLVFRVSYSATGPSAKAWMRVVGVPGPNQKIKLYGGLTGQTFLAEIPTWVYDEIDGWTERTINDIVLRMRLVTDGGTTPWIVDVTAGANTGAPARFVQFAPNESEPPDGNLKGATGSGRLGIWATPYRKQKGAASGPGIVNDTYPGWLKAIIDSTDPRKASGTGEVLYEEWNGSAWVPVRFNDWWAWMTSAATGYGSDGFRYFNPNQVWDQNKGTAPDAAWDTIFPQPGFPLQDGVTKMIGFKVAISDFITRVIDYRIYKGIVEPLRQTFPLFRYGSEFNITTANAYPLFNRWATGSAGTENDSVALAKSRAGASSPALYRCLNLQFYSTDPRGEFPPPPDGPNNTWREKTINWTRRSVADITAAPSDTPLHLWLVEPREDIDDSGYIAEFTDLSQQVPITLAVSGAGPNPKECCEFSVYTSLTDNGRRQSSLVAPPIGRSSDIAALAWLESQISGAGVLRGLAATVISFRGAQR